MDFLKGKMTPKDWVAFAGMLGLIAALFSAYYFMVHNKKLIEIADVKIANDQVEANLRQAIIISNKIQSTRDETKRIENLVYSFESKLPSKSEIHQLFETVEEMADEEAVAIEIEPLRQDRDENKETIPYQIIAKGNFHNVATFINRLERYERFLKVSDLKMEPYDIKNGDSTFKFKMNTYRFLQTMDTGDGS